MGDKWSKLVSEQAFMGLGEGLAKITYDQIEGDRYKIVKEFLSKDSVLENRLGDEGLEWPQENALVDAFFHDLTNEQDNLVVDTFREIAKRSAPQ